MYLITIQMEHPKIRLVGFNMKKLKLTQNRYTMVDNEDFDYLNQFKWHSYSKNYVARSENGRDISLHREIMKVQKGLVIDHIDGNTLNNQKNNLRVCTHAENLMHRVKLNKNNNSGTHGVGKFRNKWRARIMIGQKEIHLGLFIDIKDAKTARKEAEKRYFNEYASLNNVRGVV